MDKNIDDHIVFIDINLWMSRGGRLLRWIDTNIGEDTYKFGFVKHKYKRNAHGSKTESAKIIFNNIEHFTMFKLKCDNSIETILRD